MKMKNRFLCLTATALFAWTTVWAALPINTRLTIALTPSSKVDTRYPDGNDGSAAIPLLWAPIANISVLTNATSSINLCSTYLTQPGSPNATIAVAAGYSLPSGFSLGSTDNCVLSWATPPANSVLVRVTATRSAFVAQSNEFSISSTAPPAGDTVAPTIPTGCSVVNGTGAVTVSCDASSDPYITTAGAVTRYDFTGPGVLSNNLTAPSGGLSLPFIQTNIGNITTPSSPTCLQSGASWTCNAAGTGYVDNTADQALSLGAQVAGAASFAGKVISVSSGSPFASVGPCVSATTDPSSPELCTRAQPYSGSGVIQCRGRLTQGANKTTWGSVSVALPVYLRTVYDGAGNGTCQYSTAGNTWVDIATQAVPAIGSTPIYDWKMSSASAGTNRTFVIDQLNLNNAARISKTITTAVAGNVTVTARDAAVNISGPSAAVAVAPDVTPPPATLQKFTGGGHWAWGGFIRLTNCRAGANCGLASQIALMNDTCGEANLKGYMIRMYPQSMVDSQGVYTNGFALWDTLIAKAASCGKKIIFGIQPVVFGSIGLCTDYFPAYICTGPTFGTTTTGSGSATKVFMRVWQQATTDEMTVWLAAYGARYNSSAVVEGLEPTLESAINVAGGADGFSYSAFVTQLMRLYTNIKPSWANTVLRFHGNYMDSVQNFNDVFGMCRTLGCAFGGPDTLPREAVQGNQIYRGCTTPKTTTQAGCLTYPGRDYGAPSGTTVNTPTWAEVQSPELGGKEGTWTPAQLFAAATTGYVPAVNPSTQTWGSPAKAVQPTHMIWYVNKAFGTAATMWGNGTGQGILWFIRNNPSTGFSNCPADYVTTFGGCQ